MLKTIMTMAIRENKWFKQTTKRFLVVTISAHGSHVVVIERPPLPTRQIKRVLIRRVDLARKEHKKCLIVI